MSSIEPVGGAPFQPLTPTPMNGGRKPPRTVLVGVAVCAILLLALLIRIALVRPKIYYMPSGSMEPTIMGHDAGMSNSGKSYADTEHDRMIVSLRAYQSAAPKRNDIVVFLAPLEADMEDKMTGLPQKENTLVKRIIALPGDSIWVHDSSVWLKTPHDNYFKALKEPFVPERIDDPQPTNAVYAVEKPLTLKGNEVFVLGDNRNDSNDSRFWGPLEVRRITGKVMTIINPNTGESKSP